MSEQSAMWWVAHVIIVSAQGPNPSFFLFLGNFIRLGGLLGPGLGPGLDNKGPESCHDQFNVA